MKTYDITPLYEFMDKSTLEKCVKCRNFAIEYEQDNHIDNTNLSDCCAVADIGMTFINTLIKNKKEQLLPSEKELINAHSYFGYQILMDYGMEDLALVAAFHQKWNHYDLYERVITVEISDEIKDMARKVGTIDVYIALTSDRPYRDALPAIDAYEFMQSQKEDFDEDILRYIKKKASLNP